MGITHSPPHSTLKHHSHTNIHRHAFIIRVLQGLGRQIKELLSPLLLLALATQVPSSPSLPVTAMRLARHRDKWRSDSVSIDTEALLQRLLQKAFHSCHCAERQWCTNTRLLQWMCQLRDALIEEHYFLYIGLLFGILLIEELFTA